LVRFRANGLYDALCVLLVFPAIIMAGAFGRRRRVNEPLQGEWQAVYPLYMTHYPFMYIYANWTETTHPAQAAQREVALLLAPFVLFFAWLAVKFFMNRSALSFAFQVLIRGTNYPIQGLQ
jgi:peptidoglycan/LPS O-acetylase OafA/YrhL